MTASDLARLCEVDLKTIHNWVDRARIAHFRTPGRHLRFRAADVVEFLKAWGYSVPRELVGRASAKVLVVATRRVSFDPCWTVRYAADGYEALILAGIEPPDAVVIDATQVGRIDLAAMLGALHRALPAATLVVVGAVAELPPFATCVAQRDEADVETLLAAVLGRRMAPTPAPAESGVGGELPRKASGA